MNFWKSELFYPARSFTIQKEESSLLTPGCVYCIPIGQKHALESDRIHHKESVPSAQNPAHRSLRRKHSHPAQDFFLYYTEYRKKQITYNTPFSGSAVSSVKNAISVLRQYPLCDPLLDSFRYHCLFNILLILCSSFYSANQAHFARKDDRIYQILGLIRDNLPLPTGSLLGLIADELSLESPVHKPSYKKGAAHQPSTLILDTKSKKL